MDASLPNDSLPRDFGLSRLTSTLVFVFLVAFPLSEVLHRVDFRSPPPAELIPVSEMSLLQAAWSLAASLAVGVPLGILYSRGWSRSLRALSISAFSVPSLLAIGTTAALLRGTEFRFGLGSVVFAHAFLNAPWIALATAEGIRSVPRAWVEAARTLGASRARAFTRIELPWISRRVALASAQVFSLCLMSFGIVLVLGGGPPVSTLETEIYSAVRGGGLSIGKAAWFAAAELVLAAVPLAFAAGLRGGGPYRDSLAAGGDSGARSATGTNSRSSRVLALAIAGAWIAVPALCFLGDSTLERFRDLARDPELRSAFSTSFGIGLSAASASLATAAVFAWGARTSRFARILGAIPAGLSPLLVSLGFFLAYSGLVDPFEGSALGMVAVQTAIFLPFSLRFFLPILDEEIDGPRRDLRLAARTLGATPAAAWRKLEWPRWRSAGIRLSALVFAWSFSELAATSFFGSERLSTVGVLLVRWMGRYRFEDSNAVLLSVYVLTTAILIATGLPEGEGEET